MPRCFSETELLDLQLLDRKTWSIEFWESLSDHERETWRAYELRRRHILEDLKQSKLITPEPKQTSDVRTYVALLLEHFYING